MCTSGDDEIGDAENAFLNSQENLAKGDFVECPTSCDEISDESFFDGEAGEDLDEKLHKMLGWPLELLHAPDRGKQRVRRNKRSLLNQYKYEQYMREEGEHDQDREVAGASTMAWPRGIACIPGLRYRIG